MSTENQVICPVCNHVVSDFDENAGYHDPCEHAVLIYTDILSGEFVHEGDEALAKTLVDKYDLDEDDENWEDKTLDELMADFVAKNPVYKIVSLTTYGMACGPTSSTEFVMFKTPEE